VSNSRWTQAKPLDTAKLHAGKDLFRGILTNFTSLTILFLLVPLAELVLPASYKTPLLVLMALLAWGIFRGYFFSLRRLNSHTSQALATYNLGALGRN
jgi:hypothetical protein